MKRRILFFLALGWASLAPLAVQAALLKTPGKAARAPTAMPHLAGHLLLIGSPARASTLPAPALLAAPLPGSASLGPATQEPLAAAAAAALPDAAQKDAPAEALATRQAQAFDNPQAPSAANSPGQAPLIDHPLRLIITGPPGSGKGTFSSRIARDYGVAHISAGELLREYAKSHPEIGDILASGKLVDSALVVSIVGQRLAQPDAREHGFILDGFPRRPEEAAALEKLLGPSGLDAIITLDASEDELLRRILARGRADDKADVFRDRMRIYREQTLPAVERFKRSVPTLSPDVNGPDIESNYSRVKSALGALLNKILGR
ncbi:MAG TPA: hypothetical protein DEB40_01720 [Elusimicrobia bacterium]|nr:hypothetical protein [Elusimicrobiota bacterium]HBT60448.1 hypothetical protein [Elusimicrobiota bacterium]